MNVCQDLKKTRGNGLIAAFKYFFFYLPREEGDVSDSDSRGNAGEISRPNKCASRCGRSRPRPVFFPCRCWPSIDSSGPYVRTHERTNERETRRKEVENACACSCTHTHTRTHMRAPRSGEGQGRLSRRSWRVLHTVRKSSTRDERRRRRRFSAKEPSRRHQHTCVRERERDIYI